MALDAIYLDMDGVLVDLCGGIAEALGIPRAPFYGPLHKNWEAITDVLEHETGEEWSEEKLLGKFREWGHEFWVGLEKYPWADELYGMCQEVAPTVIMTFPAHIPTAASGKMEWIFTNLPGCERYAITSCKHHLSHPGALLIDDSVEFCGKFQEHGGDAYLFPQPWSDPSNWATRDALSEIAELLKRFSAS